MISFLKGVVIDVAENRMVVETAGIGYELTVSSYTVADKGKIGESVKIFTYMAVREDGISLYGFNSPAEKAMFLRLIAISGIGPKLAISALSGIPAGELASCIIIGDAGRLSKIKGIGKKTAERIVLELKDKVRGEFDTSDSPVLGATLNEDAVLALMSMGFSKQEAAAAVGRVAKEGLKTEEIIIKALRG